MREKILLEIEQTEMWVQGKARRRRKPGTTFL